MKSYATRIAFVRAWLFAVTVVSGLIAGNVAIAHDGKKHNDENRHVLYLTEKKALSGTCLSENT